MFCFHDGAAQGSELRLQKLPQSEDHWKEGLLSSLGSLLPVPSPQGWVTRTRAQDGPPPKDPRDTRIVVGPQVWIRQSVLGILAPGGRHLTSSGPVFSSASTCAGCYALTCAWDSIITLNGTLPGDPSPWRALHGVWVLGVELRPKHPRHPSLPPGHVAAWPEPWAGKPFGPNSLELWDSASSALKWKLNQSS